MSADMLARLSRASISRKAKLYAGHVADLKSNKCIGDDTKAAARQSPNCILKNQKYGKKTIFNRNQM